MILTINTKGGVGKSTMAMQVLATWLLSRHGSASVVELDDENKDSEGYTDTQIKTLQHRVGKEAGAQSSIERLFSDQIADNTVLDIGGNRTATMALQNIGTTGLDVMVDLIVIPVSMPGQDVTNAKKTLDTIKAEMPDYQGPIALAITRTLDDDINNVEYDYPDAFELISEYGLKGPFILPQIKAFATSRMVGQTVWEIAQNADSIREGVRAQLIEARKNNDRKELTHLSRVNAIVRDSEKALEPLEKIYTQLDEILAKPEKKAAKPKKSEAES